MKVLERDAAITGVGLSRLGRYTDRKPLDLTLDAVFEALAQAGLTVADIDGLATWPGNSQTAGMVALTIRDLKESLGLRLNWFCSAQDAAGALAGVMLGVMAVATGQARHVLCFRATNQYSSQVGARAAPAASNGPARRMTGRQGWQFPFHALSAAHSQAMIAMRRMHEFGLTKEQLGAVVLNARRNAMRNPRAVYRTPLTMDEYLAARPVTDPLNLYDCDAPVDGAVAILVSSLDAAQDLKRPPLRVEAMSGALYGRDSWEQHEDLCGMAATDAAARLWARTELRPSDVRLANVYDGFSIHPIVWLEALGFCGRGEGGEFVQGGDRIALDGELPINTGGGQLSGGRMHGLGLLWESCIQLWGEGGERQVPGDPRVALTAVGGGPLASAMLLRRD